MSTNLDQPRSREYVSEAIAHVEDQVGKGKPSVDFASITLIQVVLSVLSARGEALDKTGLTTDGSLQRIKETFTNTLVDQMRRQLEASKSAADTGHEMGYLKLLSIIDSLTILRVDGTKIIALMDEVKSCIGFLAEMESEVASRVENFMSVHARDEDNDLLDTGLQGDTSTIYGRQGILDKAKALIAGKDQDDKLELLKELFREDSTGLAELDTLLAAKHIIATCRGLLVLMIPWPKLMILDARRTMDDGEDTFDLSAVYSLLCEQLRKSTGARQFLLITEIMEMMLRTKVRTLTA